MVVVFFALRGEKTTNAFAPVLYLLPILAICVHAIGAAGWQTCHITPRHGVGNQGAYTQVQS